MNYLKELNAFYQQIIFNPLSGSAVALWNTLMHFNNLCGWQKSFSVPVSVIELKSGIKGTSFKRARSELQEKGYITVTSRDGSQAAVYQMISQVKPMYQVDSLSQTKQEKQPASEPAEQPIAGQQIKHKQQNNSIHHMNHTPDDIVDHSADRNTDHKTAHSPAPLFKRNKDKRKLENKTKHKPTTTSEAIRFYEDNFGVASSCVAEDIINWIADVGDLLVLDAMKRALEQNKASWRYVKGILKAWARKGITTVEQATANDAAFRNRQSQKFTQPAAAKAEVVPEWFKEQKRKQALEERQKQHEDTTTCLPGSKEWKEWKECERLLAKYSKRNADVC